jgi:hypothetical protein
VFIAPLSRNMPWLSANMSEYVNYFTRVVKLFLYLSNIPWRYITLSWSRALLEKPPVVQLLKNFPAFYGTQRFVTVFTRTLYWSLS